MGLGTLTGGWRVIETMGTRITKLSQHQGFSASAGASVMLFAASFLGIPVSTTHTVTGCVIGAGAARRASAVRWGVAGNVAIAWVITIPASAFVAALFYWLISGAFMHVGVAVAIIAVIAFFSSRVARRPVMPQPNS
jgi:PiT family inorganic phosphate transporter